MRMKIRRQSGQQCIGREVNPFQSAEDPNFDASQDPDEDQQRDRRDGDMRQARDHDLPRSRKGAQRFFMVYIPKLYINFPGARPS